MGPMGALAGIRSQVTAGTGSRMQDSAPSRAPLGARPDGRGEDRGTVRSFVRIPRTTFIDTMQSGE
jgi:hypothetical protein